ncbi:MAG: neutral trehalase [Candidatus Dormibacteraeota bacterium]|nr:neutral trehalase [Candidatus Dormibacteraeota bacterium]
MPDQDLRRAAIRVLEGNDAGAWTTPSAGQYPHLWNWDSALISLGWSHIDPRRAERELEAILGAQWDDGMVPHVRYDPRRLGDYFPGPDCWPGAAAHTPKGVWTSGISNPPVAVTAARLLGQRLAEPARSAFWFRVLPGFTRWLRYLADRRTLDGCPLITVVHPWESGWDNSPRWDLLREAGLKPKRHVARQDREHVTAEERPEDRDYDAYLALIELIDETGYSLARYRTVSPFLVNDVFFDAIWYRAAEDLNAMALELGALPPFSRGELDDFGAAFQERHWDPEAEDYLDYDVVADRRIRVPTPAGLAACLSGLIPTDRLRRIWDGYAAEGPGLRPLWTLSPLHPEFDPRRYWRGPVWVQVNWLTADGLERCGFRDEAQAVRRSILALVRESGFREHYNPVDGSGGGAPSFSWSAALTLDLLGR